MEQRIHKELPAPVDVCLNATKTIWTYATGMLALCIPLGALSKGPLIPIFVVLSAAMATAVVWIFAPRLWNTPALPPKNDERLAELEERLANVETLNHFDRHLAEKQLAESTREVA